MEELIKLFFPIFLLMSIGFFTKKIKLFSNTCIERLKTFIINIALPAVKLVAESGCPAEIKII